MRNVTCTSGLNAGTVSCEPHGRVRVSLNEARDKDFKKECLAEGSLGGGMQQRMTSSEEDFKPRKKKSKKLKLKSQMTVEPLILRLPWLLLCLPDTCAGKQDFAL